MGKFIEDSIRQIRGKWLGTKTTPPDENTVVRVELAHGKEARVLKIVEVGDDYIVARGRKDDKAQTFNFSQIVSWKFIDHNPKEWSW